MQLVNPDQRLEPRVTLTLRETLSSEWSITGQDHSIWRKMPLGERHLQQLSFSLMLTLGNWEAAWPVLLCRLHSPDTRKILTCSFGQRQPLVCFPSVLSLNISDLKYSMSPYSPNPLLRTGPAGKGGVNSTPSTTVEQCNVERLCIQEGNHRSAAAAPPCSLPIPLNSEAVSKDFILNIFNLQTLLGTAYWTVKYPGFPHRETQRKLRVLEPE